MIRQLLAEAVRLVGVKRLAVFDAWPEGESGNGERESSAGHRAGSEWAYGTLPIDCLSVRVPAEPPSDCRQTVTSVLQYISLC